MRTSVPSDADRWFSSTLAVPWDVRSGSALSLLESSFRSVLTSASTQRDVVLGQTSTGRAVSVAMLARPTRRNDKSFLFEALSMRQRIRRKHSDRETLLYLVVKQAIIQEIGVHAGLEPFFGSLNQVGLGIFVSSPDSIAYNPLRPSGFMSMMKGQESTSSHWYDERSFTANALAEAALGRIGQVRYS